MARVSRAREGQPPPDTGSTSHKTADLIDLDENGRALEGVLAVQVHVGPAMEIHYKDFKHQAPARTICPWSSRTRWIFLPMPTACAPRAKLPKDWKAPVYSEE